MLAELPLVFVEQLYLSGTDSSGTDLSSTDLSDTIPELEKSDRHHFERVLRIRYGDTIVISDGKGSWQKCIFDNPLRDFKEVVVEPPTSRKVGVGFCPLKGGKTDTVIAKLVEVGVDYMTPFYAEHSVVKFDDKKVAAQMVRWKKIIRQAAMQCRQVWLPTLTELGDFTELSAAKNTGHCVVNYQTNSATGNQSTKPKSNPELDFLMVGPEGGWSKAETSQIKNPVSLGPNVLRSDTAAVLAGYYLVTQQQQD